MITLKKIVTGLLFIPLCLQLTSCSDDDDNNDPEISAVVLPENITFESQSLYPEDFAYDANNNRFFTGSAYTGILLV